MTDEEAVDKFASAMKSKLAEANAEGRYGWETLPIGFLYAQLIAQFRERAVLDPVDIANFCMMIFNRENTGA